MRRIKRIPAGIRNSSISHYRVLLRKRLQLWHTPLAANAGAESSIHDALLHSFRANSSPTRAKERARQAPQLTTLREEQTPRSLTPASAHHTPCLPPPLSPSDSRISPDVGQVADRVLAPESQATVILVGHDQDVVDGHVVALPVQQR